jgi:hypothetical protein
VVPRAYKRDKFFRFFVAADHNLLDDLHTNCSGRSHTTPRPRSTPKGRRPKRRPFPFLAATPARRARGTKPPVSRYPHAPAEQCRRKGQQERDRPALHGYGRSGHPYSKGRSRGRPFRLCFLRGTARRDGRATPRPIGNRTRRRGPAGRRQPEPNNSRLARTFPLSIPLTALSMLRLPLPRLLALVRKWR